VAMEDFSTSLFNELILKHIWPLILEIWLVAKKIEIFMCFAFLQQNMEGVG